MSIPGELEIPCAMLLISYLVASKCLLLVFGDRNPFLFSTMRYVRIGQRTVECFSLSETWSAGIPKKLPRRLRSEA